MEKTPEAFIEDKPAAATNTEVTQIKPEKKGGKKWLWFCCCGCLALLLLCIGVSVGVYLLVPNSVNQFLRSTNVIPVDTSLTKLDSNTSPETIKQESAKVKTKIEAAQTQLDAAPAGTTVKVTFTPTELLYALFANAGSGENASTYLQYIAVGMKPNLLTAQVDVGGLITAMKQSENGNQLNNSPIDLSILNGTTAKVELTTTADGKAIQISNFTTGNPIIDAFVNNQNSLQSINEEINNSFRQQTDGARIESINISQDLLTLTLVK